ncbi:insoluble matrix shell protein [Acrasis kona]|uniref:Insoluble matrix shell protein n=1 Tax=Acrasis kona TaxID=1008807 RepID=A0AAW2ZL07_9EUKA
MARALVLLALVALCAAKLQVTMRIFSSRENPHWYLEEEHTSQFNSAEQLTNSIQASNLLNKNESSCDRYSNALGYTGFEVFDSTNGQCVYVVNNKELEELLLSSYVKAHLATNDFVQPIVHHVKEVIGAGLLTVSPRRLVVSIKPPANEVVKGPDNVTPYSPGKWNDNSYIKRFNNCYNYATDIRTDTFARPGKGSGKEFDKINCESVWHAAIKDGLKPLEKMCPSKEQPSKGHYVSLVIWPDYDFHWFRKDAEGYWSHKPGQSDVINHDNALIFHKKILNPDKAYIKPYT